MIFHRILIEFNSSFIPILIQPYLLWATSLLRTLYYGIYKPYYNNIENIRNAVSSCGQMLITMSNFFSFGVVFKILGTILNIGGMCLIILKKLFASKLSKRFQRKENVEDSDEASSELINLHSIQ